MKNKKVLMILSIITLVSFIIGFSYAYFTTIVIGNDTASSNITTLGSLKLTYNGTDYIDLTSAIPGDSSMLQFSVANTGTLIVSSYEVNLSRVINTFSNNEIIYEIECESSDEVTCNGKEVSPYPNISQTVIVQGSIAPGTTHTYTLNVDFIETGSSQDYNKDSHLYFTIEINELLQLNFLAASLDTIRNIDEIPSERNNPNNNIYDYYPSNLYEEKYPEYEIKNIYNDSILGKTFGYFFDKRYFWGYREFITSVTFENSINIPLEAFQSWDVSQAQNGSIVAFVLDNGLGDEYDTYYDLHIQSNGIIYANIDSSFLFNEFNVLDEINNLNLLNTEYTTKMAFMFAGCDNLTSLDFSSFDTSEVTNMSSMFAGCDNLTSLDLSSFNASSLIIVEQMFIGCTLLTSINLSNFNLISGINLLGIFVGTENLITLNLEDAIFGDSLEYNNYCIFTESNINMTIIVNDPTSYSWITDKLQNAENDYCSCFPANFGCGGGGGRSK